MRDGVSVPVTLIGDLEKILEQFRPKLYYTVSAWVPSGKVIRMAGDSFFPGVWHMHRDDFAVWGARLSYAFSSRGGRMIDYHAWQATHEDLVRAIEDRANSGNIMFRYDDDELFRFRWWSVR